jgi:signal transduction histidine kinase
VRESVFAKLVAIMVTMAACLLLLVGGFFRLIVSPNLVGSLNRVAEAYSRSVAATSPDLETARRLAAGLDLEVRYDGPEGTWSTAGDLPTVEEVRKSGQRPGAHEVLPRRDYHLVPAPRAGTYLFAWTFGRRMQEAHGVLLALLLLVMAAVVVTAHAVLRRLLGPLRVLSDGVERLSGGELDVELPRRGRDEFGRLTDAFNHMVARVREMIGARDQLLTDVSHELRSPLTRMKVALELLPDDGQRTRLAGDVVEMERMVAELLELERLRLRRDLSVAPQDLMPILREIAERFEDNPPGVRVTSTSFEVMVDIDGEEIRTVLRNLLENAVKYSLPQSRPIEVTVVQNSDSVTVRVTDDGAGIPDGDVDRIFEPFFRVDRSRSHATGGYGLGLSICKRVMEAHGGSIAVERTGSRGSSFILIFPRRVPTGVNADRLSVAPQHRR